MMVFIGYELGSKAWRFYDSVTRRVQMSHDGIFEEDHAWECSKEEAGDAKPSEMEYVTVGSTHPMVRDMMCRNPLAVTLVVNSLTRSSPGSVAMPTCGSEPCTPPIPKAPGVIEHVSPPLLLHLIVTMRLTTSCFIFGLWLIY
jgi:hypothetical protein